MTMSAVFVIELVILSRLSGEMFSFSPATVYRIHDQSSQTSVRFTVSFMSQEFNQSLITF